MEKNVDQVLTHVQMKSTIEYLILIGITRMYEVSLQSVNGQWIKFNEPDPTANWTPLEVEYFLQISIEPL